VGTWSDLPAGYLATAIAAAVVAFGVLGAVAYGGWRARRALRESEARNQAILDSAVDAIITIGENGLIESFNPSAERTFGYAASEVVGKNVALLMPGPDGDLHDEYLMRYLRTGERRIIGIGREVTARRADGSLFPVELGVSEVRLADRRLFTGIVRDLTERNKAQAELAAERNFVSAIMETAGALIVVLDREGRILRFNRACEAVTGHRAEDVKGRHVWDFLLVPEERTGVEEAFRQLRSGGGPREYENHWLTRDGRRRRITWSNTTMADPDGEVEFVIGTGIDVTERREAEDERRTLERKMQQTQKLESLGVLAGGIAHDFNNLLMGIRGLSGVALLELDSASPVHGLVERIERASRRAADLTRQMLAYAGKAKVELGSVDLTRLVRDMGELLETVIARNVVIEYELDDAVPRIEGDETQLRQVVMNLITNASDACAAKSGKVVVATGVMDATADDLASAVAFATPPPGRYVYVEVRDEGIGMEPDTRSRIFDPFFTTKFAGRGLGLAAALGIVRGHRGGIQVESEPGRGTTFRVLLPPSDRVQDEAPGPDGEEPWHGSGRVLVADDDEDARYAARIMLESLGFEVVDVADGASAVAVVADDGDGLVAVVLDLTMPGMSGAEAFRAMRTIRPELRILVSSGFTAAESAIRFEAEAGAAFIQKPYGPLELARSLRELLPAS